MFSLGLSFSLASSVSSSINYDPDAQALFSRFDIAPPPERKKLISDRFTAGKATTWWGKLDALWVHAAHGAEAGRLNWLSSSFNCLPVNDPAFVMDRGYASDGVTSYLNTQFNPATEIPNGSKYQLNSGTFGIRSNSDIVANGGMAGFWDGTQGTMLQPRNASNLYQARVNQVAPSPMSGVLMTSLGMFGASRTEAAVAASYYNGQPFASSTRGSSGPANGALRLGGMSDTSLNPAQFSMGFIGAGLTSEEHASLFNWFEPYRTALGVV